MATTLMDLADTYHEFIQPKVELKINDSLLDMDFYQEFVIELSATYQAAACQIIFQSPFVFTDEEQKVRLADELQKQILLGNKVEILVGYDDQATHCAFVGYIDSIAMDYTEEEGFSYTVECLDVKGIMMNSRHSALHKGFTRYSEAAEWVLNQYTSSLGLMIDSIDKSDEVVTVPIEQHNESDYDFVVRLAKKLNYYFYTVGKKIIFKSKVNLNNNVVINYSIGDYLEMFQMQRSLKGKVSQVTVTGNNEKDPTKPFQATASTYEKLTEGGSARAGEVSKLLTERVALCIVDSAVGSVTEAKKRAEAVLHTVYAELMMGTVRTPGIPNMEPGCVVNVGGFGKEYDKNYFVRKVKHVIKDDVFKTQCDLEANHL